MTQTPTTPLETRSREIAERRSALLAAWPGEWPNMIDAWRTHGHDAFWLMYSANYLLRTGGVRWAIDPVTLRNRVPEAPHVPVDELASLDFILMTHNHGDHVDRELLQQLAAMESIRWLVPRHMLPVAESCGVPAARIIVPEPMKPVTFGDLRVTIFEGLHREYPGEWGVGTPVIDVDAAGCLAEWAGRRVLFPGDTRTYNTTRLPSLGPVDTLFAHVWLGRGEALNAEPPRLSDLCNFAVNLQPTRRVMLTHLWEVARQAIDYWNIEHAESVRDALAQRLPEVEAVIPDFWREVRL